MKEWVAFIWKNSVFQNFFNNLDYLGQDLLLWVELIWVAHIVRPTPPPPYQNGGGGGGGGGRAVINKNTIKKARFGAPRSCQGRGGENFLI